MAQIGGVQPDWTCSSPVQFSSHDIAPDFDFILSNEELGITIQNEPLVFGEVIAPHPDTAHTEFDRLGHNADGNLYSVHSPLNKSPSPATLIRQLRELCISLSEHAATIPPLSIHQSRGQNQDSMELEGLPNASIASIGNGRSLFTIDQTFRVTQSLVNIYPCVNSTIRKPPESSTVLISHPVKSHLTQSASGPDGLSITEFSNLIFEPADSPTLDHGLIFLLLSCHHQVLDIWNTILRHMEAVANLAIMPPCQKLQVGSFVPSLSSTSTTVQSALTIELATQLLDQICQLREHLAAFSSVPSNRNFEELSSPDNDGQGREIGGAQIHIEITRMATRHVADRPKEMLLKVKTAKRLIDQKHQRP